MRNPALALLTLAGLGALLVAACRGSGEAEVVPTVTIRPIATPTATPPPVAEGEAYTPQPTEPVPVVDLPVVKSLDDLSADVAVPPLPAFAAPVADAKLEKAVRAALSPYAGKFSVVVRNLEDGRSAYLDPGRVYYAASLFKLALLLEAYRQRDAGEIDLSELQTLTQEYADYDLNTLELLGLEVGDRITIADAVKAMVIVSDTPTAVMVQDIVGPLRVNATLAAIGATDTAITTELPTTAADMATLMAAVAAGSGVTEESRREMLALLLQENYRAGIPAGVPGGTAVAHKTGNFTGASHDVALVWGPGGPYIIAVLSDRNWEAAPIKAVSSAVWDYFAAHP
jgi:beta-lactamase class A